MTSIQHFTISIPDSRIQDLKERLALAKFPNVLEDGGWELGSPLIDIKRLSTYWKDAFDWKKAEETLNQFPQFITDIKVDGSEPLKIHFLHKKSNVPGAVPLLFVHGWPGSFIEVTKIINSLTEGSISAPAFDVVAPSLAGYGFSEGPKRKGFGIEQHADTYNQLMLRLGYNEYVTQGGDWGHVITRAIALLYPTHCRANHLNMDHGTKPKLTTQPWLYLQSLLTPFTSHEKEGHIRSRWFAREGSGYFNEQSTKPHTIGYALQDSPVALLAWIYEKLVTWTDSYPWTDEEICTWISIYWFSSAGPAASVQLYWEAQHPSPKAKVRRERLMHYVPTVKIGLSHFPKELRVLPKLWTRTQGDVVFERTHDRGGHFAAWEVPELIVRDVREMFGKNGGAFRAVEGRDGYASKLKANL